MADCFICTTKQSIKLRNKSAFKSRMSANNRVKQTLVGKAKLNVDRNTQLALVQSKLNGKGRKIGRAHV